MYVRSFAFESGSPQAVGCSPVGCLDVEVLLMSVLVGATALALLAFAALVYLRGAEEVVAEERARTVAERDAFVRFGRRVARLDGTGAAATHARPGGGILSQSHTADDRLTRVRNAYRETVMGVSHYEEEYGDTLPESMAAEFCEEVATAVRDGSRFTPQLKGALLQGSEQSRTEREAFLRALDCERDAIERARDEFTDVHDALDGLDARPLPEKSLTDLAVDWERLSDLEGRCRRVVEDRQDRIHTGYPTLPSEARGVGFHEYLYSSLGVTHPVLAEGADVLADIRTARRRLLRTAQARA